MSERARIEERLRRKESEIQGLEEKLKAGRVYVQALRDVLRLLDKDEPSPPSLEEPVDALRSGSSVALARDVILRNGGPMHVNDILVAIGKEPSRETQASLIGSISAYVRRGKIFTRPAPNTFGLLELGHAGESREEGGPPPGFGQVGQGAISDDDLPF